MNLCWCRSAGKFCKARSVRGSILAVIRLTALKCYQVFDKGKFEKNGLLVVIFQKRVRVFHRGFKHEKTDESTRPPAGCFYCFRVFETPMKHEARVFEITSPTKEN